MRADLHLHSTFSDGELTPKEVAQRALEAGLDLFALTDHDECRGFADIAHISGIKAVAGIELGARHDGEVHVLGLCVDGHSPALLAHVDFAAKARENRAVEMVARLSADGIGIGMEDVRMHCHGGVIGRMHMAAALVDKGYADTVGDAFDKYLSSRTPYYVPQYKITVAEAAALIRRAGGLPVLAHPGLLKASQFDDLEPQLSDMGFWGIEAFHPSHTDGQCIAYESAARRRRLWVTVGSDYHGSSTPRVGVGEEIRGGSYLVESLEALTNESEKSL